MQPKVSARVLNKLNGQDTELHVLMKNKLLHIYMESKRMQLHLPLATVQRRVQLGFSEHLNCHHHVDVMTVSPGVDVVLCILLCAAHDQLVKPNKSTQVGLQIDFLPLASDFWAQVTPSTLVCRPH